jgi:hypothetical protein
VPIIKGQCGRPGVLAIPGDRFLRTRPFRSRPLSTKNEVISGVTRDAAGAPLGNCVVKLFRTPSDILAAATMSDASGNWSIDNPGSGPFYTVEYKAGVPDVAGTSLNTLVAS